MTDIRRFERKRDALLTAGARFIRGFTRGGMGVAGLIVLIGVTASVITAKNNFDGDVQTHQNAECIARLARSGYEIKKKPYSKALDYDVGGCYARYTLEYKPIRDVLTIADAQTSPFLTTKAPPTLV